MNYSKKINHPFLYFKLFPKCNPIGIGIIFLNDTGMHYPQKHGENKAELNSKQF